MDIFYEILKFLVVIGTFILRFCMDAFIGASVAMILFFFRRRFLFAGLSFLLCGVLGHFVSLYASIICGGVLAVIAAVFYFLDKKKEKQEFQRIDEEVGQEWISGSQKHDSDEAENTESAEPTAASDADECWANIAGWLHRIKRYPDGHFNIWHHVTPSQKKLGTEVNVDLPADYFAEHTLNDFYESIVERHLCVYGSKVKEMHELRTQFTDRGWINE